MLGLHWGLVSKEGSPLGMHPGQCQVVVAVVKEQEVDPSEALLPEGGVAILHPHWPTWCSPSPRVQEMLHTLSSGG